MKKILSLIVVFAIICSLCPVLPNTSVMTVSAANKTEFYGFEDGKLPAGFSLTYCKNPTYTNGIFSFEPQNNDPMITVSTAINSDEINRIRIRMRYDLVGRTDQPNKSQIYYAGTRADGSEFKFAEGNSVSVNLASKSSDGKFVDIDFNMNAKGTWAGANINKLRIDAVNSNAVEGTKVEIDYIMFFKGADDIDPIITYDFNKDGNSENITPVTGFESYTTVSDGCLNYSNLTGDKYDIYLNFPAVSIPTSKYEYLEIVMKHDIVHEGAKSDLLKLYVGATLADGTDSPIKNDDQTIKKPLTLSSDGQFKRYIFPLNAYSNGVSLEGATIYKLRIDPINYRGSFSIDSIRIVPHYVQFEPVDVAKTSLSYTFANNTPGCAKGTVKLNLDGQDPLFVKKVDLYWAKGNDTEGYTTLDDYTVIASKNGDVMSDGYVIDRAMYIPEEATGIIAKVTDCEKTFDVVCQLPSGKTIAKTEPKFVVAIASDFHFGDSLLAKVTPAQKFYDLKNHVEANADAMLVGGDFIQWYGVKSMDEYYYLEYLASGGTKYTDYANYDPSKENNQWSMAMDYFTSWNIPVFLAEGNHDTPSTSQMSKGHKGVYFKEWMTDWFNHIDSSDVYEDVIDRQKNVYQNTYEDSTFYDGYVTAKDGTEYHLIALRNFHMGRMKLNEQELNWLDQKLYEDEESGRPTFIVMHMPLEGTVIPDGTKHSKDFSDNNFRAVVNKHPNVVIGSGHTHYSLYSDWNLTINGGGVAPSYVHSGAVIGTGVYDPVTNSTTSEDKSKCEIVYAEVYDDMIVTRGYDVMNGKYISSAVNMITLAKDSNIDEIEVTKSDDADGNVVLTASCDAQDVEYQWYLGGVEASASSSVTVSKDYNGFVAVRATKADGSYRSASFESIYDSDILYDEGRTYFTIMNNADNGKFSVSSGPSIKEWKSGLGGKSDEIYHMKGSSESGTKRIYSEIKSWTQQNPDSKYVVIRYNAMPLNTDTYTVYLCTKSAHGLSIRSPKMTPFEWNNMTVVVDLTTNRATTYVNGEKLGDINAATFVANGPIRVSVASINDSTTVPELEAYVDDIEVYETINEPVIVPIVDVNRGQAKGDYVYSSGEKTVYIPENVTTGTFSSAFDCVVVDSQNATKSASDIITKDDKIMYYDKISGAYTTYAVKFYSDYDKIFARGVSAGKFVNDDIKLYVDAKNAGDTVIVAQYKADGSLANVDYTPCTAGLNEIDFSVSDESTNVSVLIWNNINNMTPIVKGLEITK